MRRSILTVLFLLGLIALAVPARASTESEISAATSEGKAVFLVVTQGNARGTQRAVQIAQQAQALAPHSAVVVMDRGAAENQPLVKELRVLGAPVPLILVMASNRIVAGGALLKDATPQNLVATIPSPKKAEMLLSLSQKKAVFIVVGNKHMVTERGKVFEACNQAMQTLERKAVTIVVDMEDKAEKAWLKELNVSPKETAPVTIVFSAKGQKTQVFRGPVTGPQLVTAVSKKVECCPGGSC